MVTEKSCSILEQQLDLPWQWGGGTNSASSDEHPPR